MKTTTTVQFVNLCLFSATVTLSLSCQSGSGQCFALDSGTPVDDKGNDCCQSEDSWHPCSSSSSSSSETSGHSETSEPTSSVVITDTLGTTTEDTSSATTTDPKCFESPEICAGKFGDKPYCGDAKVAPSEECDDGNAENTDACVDCRLAECGDGYVWASVEVCDDGNSISGDGCDADCNKEPVCGDGFLDTGEECDDANGDESDGCLGTCVRERRTVFVATKGGDGYTGGLSGLAGADGICQGYAQAQQLPNFKSFKAWLSAGNLSPSARMDVNYKGLYVLADVEKTVVADGWSGLVSAMTLKAPINKDAEGQDVGVGSAWTNTNNNGTSAGVNDCAGWTSNLNDAKGTYGILPEVTSAWTNAGVSDFCSSKNYLYCVEDE